jgi:hypothetical protein
MTSLPADEYQDRDDPAVRAAHRHEAELAAALIAALRAFRAALDTARIEAALRTGNFGAVQASLPYATLADDVDGATAALERVYVAAEQAESNVIALPTGTPIAGPADIDLYRSELLTDIQSATEDSVLGAVQDAVRVHLPLPSVAQAIRDAIALTPRQAQAVANYRRALMVGDSSALNRTLRDRRFDATTRRIIAGETVPEARIDQMVERYADRQLAYRARMIASTEAHKVANAGVRGAWERYLLSGKVTRGQVRRHWRVALSEGTCALCLSIPILNHGGVGLDQPFLSIGGLVNQPVVDTHRWCRCSIAYRVAANALRMAA